MNKVLKVLWEDPAPELKKVTIKRFLWGACKIKKKAAIRHSRGVMAIAASSLDAYLFNIKIWHQDEEKQSNFAKYVKSAPLEGLIQIP